MENGEMTKATQLEHTHVGTLMGNACAPANRQQVKVRLRETKRFWITVPGGTKYRKNMGGPTGDDKWPTYHLDVDSVRQVVTEYEIWAEGYRATGEFGKAVYFGTHLGESFEDACDRYMEKHPSFKENYKNDKSPPTYWGCRLFSNEAEARQSFG